MRVRDHQRVARDRVGRREVERLQVGGLDRRHRILARELRRLDLLEPDRWSPWMLAMRAERVAAGAAGRRVAVERDRRRHGGRHRLLRPVDRRVLGQRPRAVEGCRATRPRPTGTALPTIRRRP